MSTAPQALVAEALALLEHELEQPMPCVATASIVLGVLQDRLFQGSTQPLAAAVADHLQRFQEQFVAPAAAKLAAKCKTPQDKVVAVAKWLRGKLAKAPAHKQPLHTQYLPSALRDSGKRQLDCLGIATAVLALCHTIAAQWPSQHADLVHCRMVVSDDHCQLQVAHGDAAAAAVCVEVTDPGVLAPSQMQGWLYAAGHGMQCSTAQVVMVLVAGLMPEELQDEAAAQQLGDVQLQLLTQLSAAHPDALFYSNHFRWGMLHEETELEQLSAATQAATGTAGDMAALQALALLPPTQLPSQQQYRLSMARSNGWQWHPCSCAAFNWLSRMQAALCGDSDDLLCLSSQQQHGFAPWLAIATFLLQQALDAVSSCTAVLRKYSGCAGKPNKAADTQLLEAVGDLWQNLVDACKAVACLQQLQQQQQEEGVAGEATPTQPEQPGARLEQPQQPQATQAASHTAHLAAALGRAAAAQRGSSSPQLTGSPTMTAVLDNSSWLQTQLEFLDALLCFYGEESADVPAAAVADFVGAAATFTRAARVQAAADAVGQEAVHSSRVQGLVGSTAWELLEPGLQQQLQMPGSRARKRQRKE